MLLKALPCMWDINVPMQNEPDRIMYAVQGNAFRDYSLSFLAFFGFSAAYSALVPTLPIYLARLGSNQREIGVLVGTVGLSSLASRFLMGRILHRYSEKLVMAGGAACLALSLLALIVFRPFWPLFFVRLLQGIAFASFDTGVLTYVVSIVPEARRARAISYFLLAANLASAIASSGAVFIAGGYGFPVLLLTCTGTVLCALLLCSILRERPSLPATTAPAQGQRFFEPKILAPSVISFLVFFVWGGVLAFFPLYSIECGVANPGYFFSANAIMLIVVRTFGGKVLDRCNKEKMFPALTLMSMVCLVMLSLSHTLPAFIAVGLIWGVSGGFVAPVAMAYALEYAGSSDGTAVGTYQAFRDLGLTAGPITMGVIAPVTGYRAMFLLLALTSLLTIGYFYIMVKRRA